MKRISRMKKLTFMLVLNVVMIQSVLALVQMNGANNVVENTKKLDVETSVVEQVNEHKLTQAEYDAQIQKYTEQVNATKSILDNPKVTYDLKTQKQAFCSRIQYIRKLGAGDIVQ